MNRMRVICPHCKTIYQLQGADPDAILVCHRCSTEFGLGERPEDAFAVEPTQLSDTQTPDMFTEACHARAPDIDGSESDTSRVQTDAEPATDNGINEAAAAIDEPETAAETDTEEKADATDTPDDTSDEASVKTGDENQADIAPLIIPARETWNRGTPQSREDTAETQEPEEGQPGEPIRDMVDTDMPAAPPPRARARIMPWLFGVLLVIGGTGFWINHEAWLDDPRFRSMLINTGIPMEIRDKDWRVEPDSVHAVWMERKGTDSALVITGEVSNRLQTELSPPLIHVTLYARDNPDEIITERDLVITRPPLMQAIRRAPFIAPPRDNAPVPALKKRGFVLVLEDLPQNAGNFSLSARAR